jgi:putative NADPH-quinone reductase
LANKTIIEELKDSMADLEIRSISRIYRYFNIYVKAEQEAFRGIKSSFQCLLYWNSMPAFLKHWFDLVFEYQFAYDFHDDKLKGKHFIPSFTAC